MIAFLTNPWNIAGVAIVPLLFAAYLVKQVLALPDGTKQMKEIAAAIAAGARAYLNRQYRTIAAFAAVIAVILWGTLGVQSAIGFLIGALFSALAGYAGMFVAVRANVRTTQAATQSLQAGLATAFQGGTVTGMAVVGLGLLAVAGFFAVTGATDPFAILGVGFGGSLISLFARVGGGIYTKAADVGADLVGKIEAGIPEDDPRNPAVIADLVGDNVGDCAGRGADLFESTAAENIGAMILGVAITHATGNVAWVLFPLVMRAIGLVATIVGILAVKMRHEDEDPMEALDRGYILTDVLGAVGFYFVTRAFLGEHWTWFFFAGIVGIVTNFLLVKITQYYTGARYRPVKTIANSSVTGVATNIISGLSVGFESTLLPIVTITIALIVSFWAGVKGTIPGMNPVVFGLYGTAIATMGKLICAAYILAMDTLGPIVDNAGGIVEMSGAPAEVRKKTDRLDSLGNTTKALTKGYAIGTAVLATFLLMAAYMEAVTVLRGKPFDVVNLASVNVFGGAMLGGVLIFVFSGLGLMAVSKAAQYLIAEVRRQFKNKAILAGTQKPDYAACVDITTRGALREMVLPGVVVIVFPIVVGLVLRAA